MVWWNEFCCYDRYKTQVISFVNMVLTVTAMCACAPDQPPLLPWAIKLHCRNGNYSHIKLHIFGGVGMRWCDLCGKRYTLAHFPQQTCAHEHTLLTFIFLAAHHYIFKCVIIMISSFSWLTCSASIVPRGTSLLFPAQFLFRRIFNILRLNCSDCLGMYLCFCYSLVCLFTTSLKLFCFAFFWGGSATTHG